MSDLTVLRTPEERFAGLPAFPWPPRTLDLDPRLGGLRIAWVEEGEAAAAPVLLLHGEPSWSFLYRRMIPPLAAAGHRVLAPDLVGFGRSDKPGRRGDYTYQRHVDWMAAWMMRLDLRAITLVGQDWGALIGLRLVAEHPERFARVVLANGGLPTGRRPGPLAFRLWRAFALHSPVLPAGRIVAAGCRRPLAAADRAAYDAPFPSRRYQAGARAFPALVPTRPDDPAAPANRRAWEVLARWEKPFLTAFSTGDPITRGLERGFQRRVPGAAGRAHVTIRGAGHFLQEDAGEELAGVVEGFIRETIRPAV